MSAGKQPMILSSASGNASLVLENTGPTLEEPGAVLHDKLADAPVETDPAIALKKRIRALEAVIAGEKQLRRVQDETATELRKRLAMMGNPNAAASAPPQPQALRQAVDDDATVLAPRPPAQVDTLSVSTEAPAPQFASRAAPPLAPSKEGLALPIGFKLHEYRIQSLLGQGGFGITYLATDVNLNVKVAIKEYMPGDFAHRASDKSVTPRWPEDREFYQHGLDSFLVEARTLATFRHPNIVRVARFFEAHRTAYMVLEYERGKSLKAWWQAHAGMPEQEMLGLLQPLLEGLAAVHESGYLHRDIKPDNIYVRSEDGSLVLLDFGAARQTVSDPQALGNIVTPGYGPIEQYQGGDQGPWTDIYALGATLYWMITDGKPPAAIDRIGEKDPMIPAAEAGKGRYTPQFLQAVDWALKPDAKDRPQDLQEFRRVLFAAHAGSLGLQEALTAGETDAAISGESWRALLNSPRLLKASLVRFARAVARPGSWPMVVKMTLAMVLTALLPMLITSYYNLNASLASVSASELHNLEQLSQSTAGRVAQLITDNRNLANYLGTDQDFIAYLTQPTDAGKAAIDIKLAGFVKSNPDVHPLMVMDAGGTAVISTDAGVTGGNFKFREYFKEAMAGRAHMTGMVVGATAGAPGVYYSNPMRNAEGKVIGAVVMRVKGAVITGILSETQDAIRVPFLIDGDGVLIHHPDEKQLYRSLVPLSSDKLKKIVADQRFRRNEIKDLNMRDLASAMIGAKTTGSIKYESTLSGRSEIAGFAPIRGHNWVVGVTESRKNFEAPLSRLFDNVLYSVALVGLVFLIIAIFFARSIVRPIEQLTTAAHALKSGDYEKANIKVTANDEIGKLARTFNVMIDILRQRDREYKRRQSRRKTAPAATKERDA